jgi:hypothetical protein
MASCRVSFWFVGAPESGRSEPVKPQTCAYNLGTRCIKSYCLVLIASGADLCVLGYPSRPHSKEDCLYPCGRFVLHVWKHVSIRVQREGRAGMAELLRDNFWRHRAPANLFFGPVASASNCVEGHGPTTARVARSRGCRIRPDTKQSHGAKAV